MSGTRMLLKRGVTALAVLALVLGFGAPAQGASIILQPTDTTAEDVFIYEFLSSANLDNYQFGPTNFGSLLATTKTNGSGHDIRSLLRFDLSSQPLIYPGQVQSASFKLRVIDAKAVGFPVANASASAPATVEIHAINQAWAESGASGVSWDTQPTTDPSLVASAKISGFNTTVAWDLTLVVQNWVSDPASNFGFMLSQTTSVMTNGQFVGPVFASSNYGSNQPILEIVLAPQSPGDANFDGLVDGADYTIWADHFLQTGQSFVTGDFTGDGLVDGSDYTIWADNFNPGALHAAAVPEPATWALALSAIGTLGVAARRRRG